MNVYTRYFRVTEGPVVEYLRNAKTINAEANKEYAKIIEEVGAESRYYIDEGKLVGFTFKTSPDFKLWKKRQRGGYWPKKNIKAGKEIIARIGAIETMNPDDALKKVGLHGRGSFCMTSPGKIHFCTIIYLPDNLFTAYITVPWADYDPEEMKQYKIDSVARIHFDTNMDHLMWEPSSEMVEIKEWEMLRHIDEWNAKIKEAV